MKETKLKIYANYAGTGLVIIAINNILMTLNLYYRFSLSPSDICFTIQGYKRDVRYVALSRFDNF